MKPSVLVVTSRAPFVESLSEALRVGELEATDVRRLADAAGALRDDHMPVAVVIDLLMMHGEVGELCDAVRARRDGAIVPIIFCGTGGESVKSTTEALIVGGDAFFKFPVDAQKVVAKIATYAGRPVPKVPVEIVLTDEVGSGDMLDPDPITAEGLPVTDSVHEFDAVLRTPRSPEVVAQTMASLATPASHGEGALPEEDFGELNLDEPMPADRPSAAADSVPVEGTEYPDDKTSVIDRSAYISMIAESAATDEGPLEDPAPRDSTPDVESAATSWADAVAPAAATTVVPVAAPSSPSSSSLSSSSSSSAPDDEAPAGGDDFSAREQERLLREVWGHPSPTEAAPTMPPWRSEPADPDLDDDRRRLEEAFRSTESDAEEASAREAMLEAGARAEAERARLELIEQERARSEQAAAETARQSALQAAEEIARLEALVRARESAEDEARRAVEGAAKKAASEREKLEALERTRADAEQAAERALEEAQRRGAEEQARLFELEVQREEAEVVARQALEAAAAAEAAERERLAQLEEKRRIAEAEIERARQDAARRQEEERARLAEIAAERARVEEAARAALAAAAQQEEEERARLEELVQRRREAEASAWRALEESAERERAAQELLEDTRRREIEERQELEALERKRREAEEQAALVMAETERAAAAAREALDETRRKEAEELARLEALETRRKEAEIVAQEKLVEAARAEEQMRARLEALEHERGLVAAQAARATEERQRREAEERARLEALAHRRAHLEEEVRRELASTRSLEDEEEARLRDLASERARIEQQLRDALDEKNRLLAAEEDRLTALRRARAEAELQAHADLEEQRRQAAEAEARLAEVRRTRAQLEAEAGPELERVARHRAEDELARRELEEARSRARLGFQGGRLDGVPVGSHIGGIDVGSEPRGVRTNLPGPVVGGFTATLPPHETMPPAPATFVALEPPEGRFGEGELPSLLWSCHHLKVTGAVELNFTDGRARTLWLEQGEPVLVTSSLMVDRPEEGLLRSGLITSSKYNELRAAPLSSPRRAAAVLVAEGVLKPEELFPAIRGVLTEQVLSLLEHESGTFAYREEYAHAADRARLEHGFDVLLAEGIRRKFGERRLWHVLGGPASIVGPDDRSRLVPPLSPAEKLALARLDGTRALDDVVLETGIAAAVVLRTALIAVSSGAARMVARGTPADPTERLLQRERSVAIDRARILDRLQAARTGDYFTFLGVELHASPFEVQRAAERVRQRFEPMRFADPAFADLHAALKEIVEVTYDAEAVLGDEALAEGYRRNLVAQLGPRATKRRA